MSWMGRNTQTCIQPLFAALLVLTIAGCANRGVIERPEIRPTEPDTRQAVPGYVRNLPKSLTGNMSEYAVFGKRYSVLESAAGFTEQGTASWYGNKFHGRKTSSGEVYDMHAMTAAHKHLPLPTFVRVTNLENNQSVVVKVNDRGPFVGERIIDLSLAAAIELEMKDQGTANVYIEALSTHLVAENDNSPNNVIVEPFAEQVNSNETGYPEVIEPELAAVPLLEAVPLNDSATAVQQFETDVEPATGGELALNVDEVTEAELGNEGYVELFTKNDPALITETVEQRIEVLEMISAGQAIEVQEPIEVQEMVSLEQPETGKAVEADDSTYFIQLGAFGHAPNAEALVDDVDHKIGLVAFIEKDEKLELYRVKMGPFVKGDKLESAMSELAGIGIDGYTKLAIRR